MYKVETQQTQQAQMILKGERMSVLERGLSEVLGDAEGLANVLRIMSGGKLDLIVTEGPRAGIPGRAVPWEEAREEAGRIASASSCAGCRPAAPGSRQAGKANL
jgi:hypothetical protein